MTPQFKDENTQYEEPGPLDFNGEFNQFLKFAYKDKEINRAQKTDMQLAFLAGAIVSHLSLCKVLAEIPEESNDVDIEHDLENHLSNLSDAFDEVNTNR